MKKSFRRTAVLLAVCPAAAGLSTIQPASARSAALAASQAAATAALPYGPYTCQQGYVWREAYPGDGVCVTPDQRAMTLNENNLGPSRRQPGRGASGPDTCLYGYVWREARPSDHVCVPLSSRNKAKTDNYHAPWTLQDPTGTPTNGIAVNEVRTPYPPNVQFFAYGTFTPNNRVQFYAYDPSHARGDAGFVLLADVTTDGTGRINSDIFQTNCFQAYLTAPVIAVDQGTGLVSSSFGPLAAPWC